jgi:hypothetical protein
MYTTTAVRAMDGVLTIALRYIFLAQLFPTEQCVPQFYFPLCWVSSPSSFKEMEAEHEEKTFYLCRLKKMQMEKWFATRQLLRLAVVL